MKTINKIGLGILMVFNLAMNAQDIAINTSSSTDAHNFVSRDENRLEEHEENRTKTIVEKPKFEFFTYQMEEQLEDVKNSSLSKHFLGESSARRAYVMDSHYRQIVQVAPGSPATKIVYRKPIIYKAVKKIEKQMKKQVKKEIITPDEATRLYNKTLEVAINAIAEDTKDFENEIKKTETTDQLLALFYGVNLLTY